MLDVTDQDCGAWITAEEVRNYLDFTIRVIDLAVANGLGIDNNFWERERAVIIAGVADTTLLEFMDELYYDAIEYLNNNLPSGYSFIVNHKGLFLTNESYVMDWS